jgi:hypothetical protein
VEIAQALRDRFPGISARKAMRLAHGWTQEEAAAAWTQRFGEPKAAKLFSYWENWPVSGHSPSLETLDRLAQLYRCSAADLLADLPDYGGPGSGESAAEPETLASPGLACVGPDDVEVVRTVTRALAGAENMLGGQAVTLGGTGQLHWASGMLTARATPSVRRDLVEAVGNLAAVVGFATFDAGGVAAAERCFELALACADEAGSWSLRACTLADIARVHAETGRVDAALSAIELAQVRGDRLPATARAMLCVNHARYLAVLGRVRDALAEVEAGDEWFAAGDPAADPPWLCYYDRAEHDGSVGRALMSSDVVDVRLGPARARLESAVQRQRDAYPRSRAFSGLRLARLLAVAGVAEEAVDVGEAALADATDLRSRRLIRELGALDDALRRHAAVPVAHRLRAHIRARMTEPAMRAAPGGDG